MSAESLACLERDGYIIDPTLEHTLTFRGDGTVIFNSAFTEIGITQHQIVDGIWALDHKEDSSSSLNLKLYINGAERSDTFSFAEENSVVILWQTLGDPDMWEFIEYNKN